MSECPMNDATQARCPKNEGGHRWDASFATGTFACHYCGERRGDVAMSIRCEDEDAMESGLQYLGNVLTPQSEVWPELRRKLQRYPQEPEEPKLATWFERVRRWFR